tara:strand:+ start:8288 stop:8830 length:543 start_codon:yes stop_codon:yes gene_type:complete
MIVTKSELNKVLLSMGLRSNDTVMLHIDSGVATQMVGNTNFEKLNYFIMSLMEFFKHGTILVPTFTYSSTKGEQYDPKSSSSAVGLFSEAFRKLDGVDRTDHPIFSFAIFGTNKKIFKESKLDDCFGLDTVFDHFNRCEGKVVCINCIFEPTYVHHLEQKKLVNYRYFKTSCGITISINE